MSVRRQRSPSIEELPKARISRNWSTYVFWLVPLGAAGLAASFLYTEVLGRGPTLTVYFEDAAGLQPGKSEVKYRGATIGTVEDIILAPDHQRVEVTVSLDRSATNIAREGSRFWIVKPEVAIAEIRGLRTIVSGDYMTVEPGNGQPQITFTGLSEPPTPQSPGGLHIVLLAERLGSIRKGAPVFYRGIQVGDVVDTELGAGSQTVRITVQIQKRYRPLVRMNSRFWNVGGINASIGLTGVGMTAQSMQTLITGGLAFATPDTREKEAPSATAFRLYDKPDEAWLTWAPTIKLAQ